DLTQLQLRGLSGSWLAYVGFAILSLVSVVANGTHSLMTADMTRTTPWAAALLGAVPPATLLVMTHVLMKLIPDEKERARMQARRAKEQAKQAVIVRDAAPTVAPQAPAPEPVRATVAAHEAGPLRLVNEPAVLSVSDSDVAARVAEHIAAHGAKPTGAVVGEWLGGKSAKTGQRKLKQLEEAGLFGSE